VDEREVVERKDEVGVFVDEILLEPAFSWPNVNGSS